MCSNKSKCINNVWLQELPIRFHLRVPHIFFLCINIEMLSYAKHVLIANFRSFYLYSSFFASIESSWSCEIEKWEKEMVRTRRKESRRNVTCKLMYIFFTGIYYVSHRETVRTHPLFGWFILLFLFVLAKYLFLLMRVASKSQQQGITRLRKRKIDLSSLFRIRA